MQGALAGRGVAFELVAFQGLIRNRLDTLPAPLKGLAADYRRLEESLPKFQRAATLVEEGPGFDAPSAAPGLTGCAGEPAERRYLEVVRGVNGNPPGTERPAFHCKGRGLSGKSSYGHGSW